MSVTLHRAQNTDRCPFENANGLVGPNEKGKYIQLCRSLPDSLDLPPYRADCLLMEKHKRSSVQNILLSAVQHVIRSRPLNMQSNLSICVLYKRGMRSRSLEDSVHRHAMATRYIGDAVPNVQEVVGTEELALDAVVAADAELMALGAEEADIQNRLGAVSLEDDPGDAPEASTSAANDADNDRLAAIYDRLAVSRESELSKEFKLAMWKCLVLKRTAMQQMQSLHIAHLCGATVLLSSKPLEGLSLV